jgi:hypothetical protein
MTGFFTRGQYVDPEHKQEIHELLRYSPMVRL